MAKSESTKIEFGYFHDYESEQFAFYRIPKVLFTDEYFRNLSSDAKVLYGLMLDRMALSIRNNWVDNEGKVYIIFTLEQVIPTVHMGVAATQMERRGIVTDKGNQNREIREQNRLLKEVKRRIAALTAWIKEKTAQTKENPFLSVPILSERSEQPSTLLELLNRAYTEAAKPQSRYEKIQDLKLYAKAFNFLQSRNITTLVQLQEVVSDMKKQYWTTNGEIKQTEKLLHERKELIDQAEKYREHRPTYKAYMQTNSCAVSPGRVCEHRTNS